MTLKDWRKTQDITSGGLIVYKKKNTRMHIIIDYPPRGRYTNCVVRVFNDWHLETMFECKKKETAIRRAKEYMKKY